MKLRISAEARRDLIAIARFGALRFGLAQSEAYAERIALTLRTLQSAPEIAAVKTGHSRPVRLHPVGAHKIVYELQEDRIVIVRVLHAGQNLIDHI